MTDYIGKVLLEWRVDSVLPWVRGKLLDIGCGTNELARKYNATSGCMLGTGVDVYGWPGVDLVVADTSCLPFDSESFDTITIVAALNHIPNRAAVLREAHRLLRPAGRLVVTMIPPRISRLWHWLRRRADADQAVRGMKPGEVYGLSQRDVEHLLAQAGFTCALRKRFMLGINSITVADKLASGA